MEPKTRLDHAVFQLTPTRTRCDLVAFSGKKSEKLASGLLEPFLSHLKYAKDQISKGGYSITVKPAAIDAAWFTKATLERFVRFVSTPEVLERFVTIEKEIAQIESSVQSNEQINLASEAEGLIRSATSSKIKAESNGSNDAEKEENSKVHLHRALETRKTVLRKEQAMAYARALAAGYEIDCIDDLLSFAETFGALRLREACINFMDLCNKKNEDRIWMDEIAAMQAYSHTEYPYLRTSGVILAGEDNDPDRDIMMNTHVNSLSVKNQNGPIDASASGSTTSTGSLDANQAAKMHSTDGKAQMPMWANHPQYMQNFQGPIFQHMAPYQGYHFPGMQGSPFYSGNMPWPSNVEYPGLDVDQESVPRRLRKEKFSNGKGSCSLQRDDSNEDNVSSSQSNSDDDEGRGRRHSSTEQLHTKKNARSSSRKVVIRNINYITSKRGSRITDSSSLDDYSGEDEVIDADSLKQQVEEAVGSQGKHHKLSPRSSRKQDGSKKRSSKSNNTADQDVENDIIVNSAEEKRNENWNIFQDLLLRDEESRSNDMDSVQVQEARVTRKSSGEQISSAFSAESENLSEHRPIATDSFLLSERHTHTEGSTDKENNIFTIIKSAMDEELLYSSNLEQSRNISQVNRSDGGNSIIKSQKGEDWLIFNQQDKLASQGREVVTTLYSNQASTFVYDHLQVEQNKKDLIVDDSFMVQDRSISELPDSQRETDIFMVSDITAAGNSKQSIQDNLQQRFESIKASQPDDLHVVLVRHSSAEQFVTSWNPEMDYVNESMLVDAVKRHSDIEQTDSVDKVLETGNGTKSATDKAAKGKVAGKEIKPKTAVTSLQKSKSEMMSRSKKSPSVRRTTTQKDKAEKVSNKHLEEESRKKMEELLIQRQKRIAERSAAKGPNTATSITKEKESKAVAASSKIEKPKLLAANEEKKKLHKPVMRSSTIERLAAARTTSKQLPTESKARQTKKVIKEENGLSKKTAGTRNKKLSQNNVKSSNKRTETIHSSESANISDDQEKNCLDVMASMPKDSSRTKVNHPGNVNGDFQNINESCIVSLVQKNEGEMISHKDALDEKSVNQRVSNEDLPVPADVQSTQSQYSKVHNEEMPKASRAKDLTGTDDSAGVIHKINIHPSPITSASRIDKDGMGRRKFPVSPEISVTEFSTPPPGNETSPELSHSRQKWNSGENVPNFTKGIRKLLFFGRRS